MKTVLTSQARRRPSKRFAALVGAVVFLVLAGSGGAAAFWTAASQGVGGTVASTSISTTMTGVNGLDTTWSFAGAASNSPIVYATIPVTNTGGAPLSYTLAITNTNATLAGLTKLWLWNSTGACTAIPVGTAQITLSTAAPTLPTTNLAAGSSFTLCAATQLNSTVAASSGQSVTATFTITGRVGTNWVTTATGTTTQNVASIGVLSGVACVDFEGSNDKGVTISWSAVSAPSQVTYYLTGNGSPAAIWNGTTLSATVFGTRNPSVNGATVLYLQAKTASGGASNIVTIPIIRDHPAIYCG
ncbi:MAG TPA: hypothetical protein VNT53_09505 [Pseudolysinimonas sp.]|nr:hypothetical protein [Pseudolysinimonas sp.]